MSSSFKIISIFAAIIILISLGVYNIFGKGSVNSQIETYIKNNPEVILDSIMAYQKKVYEKNQKVQIDNQKKLAENISLYKDELENDSNTPFIGNPKGDVVIVEFFDYNCGFCKRVKPVIEKLIKEDSNVKIVLKEFPILGQASLDASLAAISVFKIDSSKYDSFHRALMYGNARSIDEIFKIAEKLEVDKEKLKEKMASKEVKDIINNNRVLAKKIGVNGTPSFIMNNELIQEAVSVDYFLKKIKDFRDNK